MKYASEKDEVRYEQLNRVRKMHMQRLMAIDRELAEISRRAYHSLEDIMRREG